MKQQNEKDEDANVTWIDQNNINQFSKCNASWSDLESRYEKLTVIYNLDTYKRMKMIIYTLYSLTIKRFIC